MGLGGRGGGPDGGRRRRGRADRPTRARNLYHPPGGRLGRGLRGPGRNVRAGPGGDGRVGDGGPVLHRLPHRIQPEPGQPVRLLRDHGLVRGLSRPPAPHPAVRYRAGAGPPIGPHRGRGGRTRSLRLAVLPARRGPGVDRVRPDLTARRPAGRRARAARPAARAAAAAPAAVRAAGGPGVPAAPARCRHRAGRPAVRLRFDPGRIRHHDQRPAGRGVQRVRADGAAPGVHADGRRAGPARLPEHRSRPHLRLHRGEAAAGGRARVGARGSAGPGLAVGPGSRLRTGGHGHHRGAHRPAPRRARSGRCSSVASR